MRASIHKVVMTEIVRSPAALGLPRAWSARVQVRCFSACLKACPGTSRAYPEARARRVFDESPHPFRNQREKARATRRLSFQIHVK